MSNPQDMLELLMPRIRNRGEQRAREFARRIERRRSRREASIEKMLANIEGPTSQLSVASNLGPVTLRDENGWLVPGEGTKRRQVYDLLREGKTWREICAAYPDRNARTLAATISQIKNPSVR